MAAGCPVASRPLASACLIQARPHTQMHGRCGCAACADAGQECILPSTASPLLAGSWAPPCHRCPTKVCIAGRTGEEQPVLPFRDACHSNYLRSEPLLRRTFIDCFAWVVFPLCLACLTLAQLCGFDVAPFYTAGRLTLFVAGVPPCSSVSTNKKSTTTYHTFNSADIP